MKKLLATIGLLTTLAAQAALTNSTFTVSVTGGTGNQWMFNGVPPAPEHPTLVSTNGHVGSNTVYYGGHSFTINVPGRQVVVDGIFGPTLTWNGNIVAVSHYYGLCVDTTDGTLYLACQYNDGDPTYYLFTLNPWTGQVVYIDTIGIGNEAVTGMICAQYGGILEGF